MLGASRLVTTWHEQVLLRCYYEMIDAVVPARTSVKPPNSVDLAAARALVQEVNSVRMRDAVSRQTRDELVRVLAGRVDRASGTGSEDSTEQRAAARALRDAWVHLADRSRDLGDSVPPIPRESLS